MLPASGLLFDAEGLQTDEPCRVDADLLAPFLTVELTPQEDAVLSAAGIETRVGDVWADYNAESGRARIMLKLAGRTATVLTQTMFPGEGFRTAVSITENIVTLWRWDGAVWRVLLTHPCGGNAGIDLRDAALLTTSRLFYQGDFRRVRAGYFGYLGVRDPQLVRDMDGEPVRNHGRLWITATCAGPGFFPTAHWAVFSFSKEDPADLRLESHVFFDRNGRRLGDHAGFILRGGGTFVVGVSSWGDFDRNAHVRWATTEEKVLEGVHVLESNRWDLPTAFDAWDPSLLHHAGRWWLAFVECTSYDPRFSFRPALARSARGVNWDGPLEHVGSDTTREQTEGTLLTLLNGRLYVLASDGDASDYPIYDARMAQVDLLAAPYFTNIPHPLVIDPDDEPLILTFDGTTHDAAVLGYGTHGDVIVLRGRRR
ncbi:hypothetical protein BKD30_03985 [Tersicoccus phoenicis]|uniref:Uncharacterized protein n=1 Tax=Tersicoccus phoenicis TaxID=554083 RepID=A0A1R1LHP0_9MICC|nr:hypothetical protein BKD30_03985 [Tersicoccus phoenicis]